MDSDTINHIIYLSLGVCSFASLAFMWAYMSYSRKLCPLTRDSLLNGAVLFGIISIMLFSDILNLIDSENRANINIIFSVCAAVIQVQILYVHRAYHAIVGPEEP
jgi:hypothetical protein